MKPSASNTRRLARLALCGLLATGRFTAAAAEPVGGGFAGTLTGDWGGQRSGLAERGILVELANTTDLFANLEGGAAHEATASNLLEAAVTVDMRTLAGPDGGTLFLLAVGTHGEDPGEAAGTLHAPSNLAAGDAWRLLELWYEHRLLGRRLALLAGVYAVDAEFDVKETAEVFVNGGFGTGLDLSETGLNGPSVFPTTGLGLRLRARPTPEWTLQAALVDGVPGDPGDPTATDLDLSGNDGTFVIGEANYVPHRFRLLRFGLGAWRYTTDFEDLIDTRPNGEPVIRDDSQGVYAFAEGIIFSETAAANEGLSGFVRIGRAGEDVNQIGSYYGAGLVYTGLLPGRNTDVLGVGVSMAVNGDKFRAAQALAGTPVNERETLVELTYRAQVASWLSVQPVLQYAHNPGTDPGLDDSLGLGIRLAIDL